MSIEKQNNDSVKIAVSVFHALFYSLGNDEKQRFMNEIMNEINMDRQEETQFLSAGYESFFRDESPDDEIYDNYPENKITKK